MTSPPSILRIFVSHSSKDSNFGIKLVRALRRVLGDEDAVWYDELGGLEAGDRWWRKIVKELRDRWVFIVVLSPNALTSSWVNDEINIALRQKEVLSDRLIV